MCALCTPSSCALSTPLQVKYWERFKGPLRVVIPYTAHDIANQRDKLRSVREHVMLVVRAYNDILEKLTPTVRACKGWLCNR